MDEAQASGHVWREGVRHRPTVEQDRDALARLIEFDADPFKVQLYEWASDPQALRTDRAQRSRAGQYARHVRRLKDRAKHAQVDGNADGNVHSPLTTNGTRLAPPTSARSPRPGMPLLLKSGRSAVVASTEVVYEFR